MPRKQDDDDDDRPSARRKPSRDDDDDRPTVRRKPIRTDDEDDDDRPTIRRRRPLDDNDDDDDRRRRQRKARPRIAQTSPIGIVGLVIGILALIVSIFMPCLASWSLVPAGIGTIMGFVALFMAKNSEGRYGLGMPIAGLSVSCVAMVIAVGWLVLGKQVEKKLDKLDKEWQAEAEKIDKAHQAELAKAANEVKSATAPIRLSALQFAKAYDDDGDRADGSYKNKVLEITGIVDEVDFTGDTYAVILKAGPDETVHCEFAKDPATRALLGQLLPGANVIIRGKCLGGGAVIEACVLVQ